MSSDSRATAQTGSPLDELTLEPELAHVDAEVTGDEEPASERRERAREGGDVVGHLPVSGQQDRPRHVRGRVAARPVRPVDHDAAVCRPEQVRRMEVAV